MGSVDDNAFRGAIRAFLSRPYRRQQQAARHVFWRAFVALRCWLCGCGLASTAHSVLLCVGWDGMG